MSKRRPRPADPTALLDGGLTIREAAEQHGVPKSTLARWIASHRKERAKRPNVHGTDPRTGRCYGPEGASLPRGQFGDRQGPDPTYVVDGSAPAYTQKRVREIRRQGDRFPRPLTSREEWERVEQNRAGSRGDVHALLWWRDREMIDYEADGRTPLNPATLHARQHPGSAGLGSRSPGGHNDGA